MKRTLMQIYVKGSIEAVNFYQKAFDAKLAHNVLSMRRSSPPYKANRRFAVGWNVGERKPHKAVGDCGFSNPEPPNRRRSSYCLLSDDFFTPTCNRRCTWTYNGVKFIFSSLFYLIKIFIIKRGRYINIRR